MGMTIEEHIEALKSYHHGFTGCVGNLQDSINVAIDTMRKYQQIEQIIKSWKDGTLEEKDSIYAFHKIIEVVENGNGVPEVRI